jgi:hypothetical protein
MEETLISVMLADSGITALVGNRIHWDNRPQGSGDPAIVMHNLGGSVDYHMEGSSRLREARIQIECWSNDSPDEALAIRRAVETALSGLQRFAGSGGEVDIQGMFVDGLNQGYQHFAEASEDAYLYRVDFLMWCEEQESVT